MHRTARLNEYSGRYSEMPLIFYTPKKENCGFQSSNNKQGRTEAVLTEGEYSEYLEDLKSMRLTDAEFYKKWLKKGMARELARTELPLSLYTYMYWQIDLHNLFHFLKLRLDSHAQYEIREYARVFAGFAKLIAPIAFEAFEDYQLYSENFSFEEMKFLKARLSDSKINIDDYNLSQREKAALSNKLFSSDVQKQDFTIDFSISKSPDFYQKLIEENL